MTLKVKEKICKYCKEKYTPQRPLQYLCSPLCAINYSRAKKATTTLYIREIKEEEKLRRKADRLYQIKHILENPICLVCGSQTTVIHHYVNKARSNHLRYSKENAIPLCNECHCAHHKSGDPRIVATIIDRKGIDWHNELQKERKTICKLTERYLIGIIEEIK